MTKAISKYEPLFIREKSLSNTINYAEALIKTGRHEDGISIFEDHEKKFNENPFFLMSHSKALKYLGKKADSLNKLKKAQSIKSGLPLWTYYETGQLTCASYIAFSQQLGYVPIPKNGSSTLSKIYVQITENKNTINPHQFYENPYFVTRKISEINFSETSLCVLREPVERLISYYLGNIIKRSSLEPSEESKDLYGISSKPSISEFFENLDKYIYCYSDVHHHTLPQSAYVEPIRKLNPIFVRLENLDQFITSTDILANSYTERLMKGHSPQKTENEFKKISPEGIKRINKFVQSDMKYFSQSKSQIVE